MKAELMSLSAYMHSHTLVTLILFLNVKLYSWSITVWPSIAIAIAMSWVARILDYSGIQRILVVFEFQLRLNFSVFCMESHGTHNQPVSTVANVDRLEGVLHGFCTKHGKFKRNWNPIACCLSLVLIWRLIYTLPLITNQLVSEHYNVCVLFVSGL